MGDVTDPDFMKKLKDIGFKSVICSNLLEHVPNKSRKEICDSLIELIQKKVTSLFQDHTNSHTTLIP